MDIGELIVKEITRSALKSFVCDIARDQKVVQDAVRSWASDLYDYIKDVQALEANKTK